MWNSALRAPRPLIPDQHADIHCDPHKHTVTDAIPYAYAHDNANQHADVHCDPHEHTVCDADAHGYHHADQDVYSHAYAINDALRAQPHLP